MQKRFGSRSHTAVGVRHSWTSQLEHGETCSTPEATRGHYARDQSILGGLKLADPGVTIEPRGLTEATSRPIFSLPLLSPDAGRLWTCVARVAAQATCE